MQDSNERDSVQEKEKELAERRSEATSDETLSDLEEVEEAPVPSDSGLDPGPSPDGLLDEPGEIKDAGPM
jgi:hypothetical protein